MIGLWCGWRELSGNKGRRQPDRMWGKEKWESLDFVGRLEPGDVGVFDDGWNGRQGRTFDIRYFVTLFFSFCLMLGFFFTL